MWLFSVLLLGCLGLVLIEDRWVANLLLLALDHSYGVWIVYYRGISIIELLWYGMIVNVYCILLSDY